MKTTFVLHGGATKKESIDNDQFFKLFTSLGSLQEVKILICYLARKKDEWKVLLRRDEPKIRKFSNKKIKLSVVEDVEDLYAKLKNSDVLYVAGGEPKYLEPYYPKLKDLQSALKDKVYLGSSMGAFMVSKNYILSSLVHGEKVVHQGLGILPINTLCHWNIEKKKEKKIKLLKKADSQTPILLLDEGKFSIFVK